IRRCRQFDVEPADRTGLPDVERLACGGRLRLVNEAYRTKHGAFGDLVGDGAAERASSQNGGDGHRAILVTFGTCGTCSTFRRSKFEVGRLKFEGHVRES